MRQTPATPASASKTTRQIVGTYRPISASQSSAYRGLAPVITPLLHRKLHRRAYRLLRYLVVHLDGDLVRARLELIQGERFLQRHLVADVSHLRRGLGSVQHRLVGDGVDHV